MATQIEAQFDVVPPVKTDAMETRKEMPPVAMAKESSSPASLLHLALSNGAAIDVIERLAALQEKAQAKDAEAQFNHAMNAVQAELPRVAPTLYNTETKSKYPSYVSLDKVVRPVYLKHGFSLSFDTADCPIAEHARIVCYVSNAGHVRRYQVDMSCDGKGPKGGGVMSKTHATGAAMSYGMRYLLKFIFNIAIGEDDTDGNAPPPGPQMDQDELRERIAHFPKCETFEELEQHFRASYVEAKKAKDQGALDAVIQAKNKRKVELRNAGAQ